MNFIQQAYKGKNEFWRYIISFLVILIGWQFIGAIPLLIVAVMYSKDINDFTESARNNFLDSGINSNLFLFLMILTFAIGLIFLFMSVKYIHKRSKTSLITSRAKIDWKRFFYAFSIWFVFSIVTLAIGYFMEPETYTWNFKPIPFLILVLISFAFLPLQTSFEELFFRGYMMQGLGIYTVKKHFPFVLLYLFSSIAIIYFINSNFSFNIFYSLLLFISLIGLMIYLLNSKPIMNLMKNKSYLVLHKILNTSATPLIFTSVLFGLLHGANPEVEKLGYIVMVYYIGTGFLLGIMTLMDEGTELSLGFHAANNIVAAVFITNTWSVFQTEALLIDTSEPSVGLETFLPVFVIYPIILFIFSKKYGWTNWKDKLFGKITKPPTSSSPPFFKEDNMLEL